MKTKLFYSLMATAFILGCQPKKETKKETKDESPNVVLFLVDDLGWTDLGSYGSELYRTPHVDALAKQGVKFTNAYSACTVCSPTRASIMTGKYPARINCTDWIEGHIRPFAKYQVPDWTMHIDPADSTLAESLRSKGYSTVHIGKWHLGEEEQYWPENHGFDKNIGGWRKGGPNKVKKVGGYFTPYNNPRLEDGPEGEYLTERLSQEAVSYIDDHKSGPFFMNFWLYNVHTPLEAKADKIEKYNKLVNKEALQSNPIYAAMVEHMDEALGAVVNKLKAEGLYDNTIIIFASDNGGLTGTRGVEGRKPRVTSNHPLKSGKGDIYEGGVRTPFIVSWPKKIKPKETDALAISTDIYPTVLGLINQEPSGIPFDGKNLSSLLLEGGAIDRDALYWHYPHYHTEGAEPYSAIRKGDWKLISVYGEEQPKLYNLETDISESNDLVDQYPEMAKALLKQLNNWKQEVKAQDPMPNPNYDPKRENKWR